MIKAVLFDVDGMLLDSFEANFKFYQNLMLAAGYQPPTLEEFRPLFHLPMYDGIKIMTKSTAGDEIRGIDYKTPPLGNGALDILFPIIYY